MLGAGAVALVAGRSANLKNNARPSWPATAFGVAGENVAVGRRTRSTSRRRPSTFQDVPPPPSQFQQTTTLQGCPQRVRLFHMPPWLPPLAAAGFAVLLLNIALMVQLVARAVQKLAGTVP